MLSNKMMRHPRFSAISVLFLSAALSFSCRGEADADAKDAVSSTWTEASHSNDVEPDYDTVFGVSLLSLRIEVTAEVQEQMSADLLTALANDETPSWFEATVFHDDKEWQHVGVRYRGSGTIDDILDEGGQKLPLKLNFEKFEDQYEAVKNQRFYGFKKLILLTSAKDDSMVRDVLASETFLQAGVPAARATFSQVVYQAGDTAENSRVYTLMEDIDDAAFQNSQFGENDGNLYKPEGTGSDFSLFVESSFEKKNNAGAADYSDVQAAIDALHADQTDAAAWRKDLSASFDVDGFLRFFAVNTAMGNKDSYGCDRGNYYLYASPLDEGRLSWIPTDLDRAFSDEMGACADDKAGPEDYLYTGDHAQWPLIDLLLSDETYRETYEEYLLEALDGAVNSEDALARARELQEQVVDLVFGDEGESAEYRSVASVADFEAALAETWGKDGVVSQRHAEIRAALTAQ